MPTRFFILKFHVAKVFLLLFLVDIIDWILNACYTDVHGLIYFKDRLSNKRNDVAGDNVLYTLL